MKPLGPMKRLRIALAALVTVGALAAVAFLVRLIPIGTAYEAKILCSAVFVSGRDPADVLATDLNPDELHPLLRQISAEVDRDHRRVRASFWGLFTREAVYRPGFGSVLAIGGEPVPRAPSPVAAAVARDPAALWPDGSRVEPGSAALQAVVEAALTEPDPARPRRTRAAVVVHRGRIVAEAYAPGFGPDTPLLGWSMTKSVTATLAGVLVREGRWALDRPLPVPEWSGEGDPRGGITLEQLLQMRSGLAFDEDYANPLGDVTAMLFASRDAGAFAADHPLATEAGGRWAYSSGTTNIICRAMEATLGEAYPDFPRRVLFGPIGMKTAVLETDAAGHFIGSSFGWASARDWARFGLLWLQDGVWGGQRILPEGWVRTCTQPAPGSNGRYGGHVWLPTRDGPDGPALPDGTFHFSGHEQQRVTVVPSRQAVIVRLGLTRGRGRWDQGQFVLDVLAALPE